jgi:hypothetical protein
MVGKAQRLWHLEKKRRRKEANWQIAWKELNEKLKVIIDGKFVFGLLGYAINEQDELVDMFPCPAFIKRGQSPPE